MDMDGQLHHSPHIQLPPYFHLLPSLKALPTRPPST